MGSRISHPVTDGSWKLGSASTSLRFKRTYVIRKGGLPETPGTQGRLPAQGSTVSG